MTIIRVEKRGDYAVLPNAVLNDARLSWEARGLLAYLLSKPNHWHVNSRALTGAGPAGRAKIQRILRELEEYGYLERRRVRGPGGRFVWESVVREAPRVENSQETSEPAEPAEAPTTMAEFSGHGENRAESTMAGFSADGKPADGKPADGKPADGKTADGKPADGKTADGKTADGKTADGKPGHIANTEQVNTEQANTEQANTQQANGSARKTPTRAMGQPPLAAAAAQPNQKTKKQSLPPEIRAMLRKIGWRGSMREVAVFWQREPERVRALLRYGLQKGWGGGLLRNALRSGEWPPPEALEDEDPTAKYKNDPFARFYE